MFSNLIYAQFNSAYLKSIAKENYIDVEKKLLKDLQKKPNDVELNFSMSILYKAQKFQGYNLEKSYEYLMKAKSGFENTTKDKDIKKLNKIPINKEIIEKYTDTISFHALHEAIDMNTLDAFEKYLSIYKNAPEDYQSQMIELKNQKKYQFAIDKNTVEAFQEFITNNSGAKQIADAYSKRNQLAFERAMRSNKIADFKEFINKYPDATEAIAAYDRIHELAYIQAERENTSAAYKFFIEEYPSSKQYSKAVNMMEKRQYMENTTSGDWKKYRSFIEKFPGNSYKMFAQDSIFQIGSKTENLEILNYCVDNFTGENRDKALLMFYKIFTFDGEKSTLNMFYSKYDGELFNDLKITDYKLAAMGDSLMRMIPKELNKPIFEKYIKDAAPKEKAFLVMKKLIIQDIDAKNWSAALEKAKLYQAFFQGNNKRLNDLIYMLGVLQKSPKINLQDALKSETKPKDNTTEVPVAAPAGN